MNAPLNVQVIKSLEGEPEYVLLPYAVYSALRKQIDGKLASLKPGEENYIPFELENYVDNPVALARIKAGLTQEQLADRMGVSQPYIAKLEAQNKVTAKVFGKVATALEKTLSQKRQARKAGK